MKILLILIGIILFFALVGFMLAYNFIMRIFRNFREAMKQQEEFLNDSRRSGNFTGRRSQQYAYDESRRERWTENTSKTHKMENDESVIDQRGRYEKQQIFSDDEGEYVEFTEE